MNNNEDPFFAARRKELAEKRGPIRQIRKVDWDRIKREAALAMGKHIEEQRALALHKDDEYGGVND